MELLVSLLQHPQEAAAPAPISKSVERDDHPLGIVPHQIRGFLSTFENLSVTGQSYQSCSACSEKVVGAYREQGWEFVRRALNEKGYVEELSGLREVSKMPEVPGSKLTHVRSTRKRKQLSRILSGTKDPITKRLRSCREQAFVNSQVGCSHGEICSYFMAFAAGQRKMPLWIPVASLSLAFGNLILGTLHCEMIRVLIDALF